MTNENQPKLEDLVTLSKLASVNTGDKTFRQALRDSNPETMEQASTGLSQVIRPEQKLSSFPSFPMSDLVAPYSKSENEIAVLDTESTRMTEKLITHLRSYIENVLGRDIEIHKTDFGFILVVQIEDNKCIAFALGKEWPNEVLQVNWLDRSNGSSTEIDVNISNLNVKNFKEFENIILEVKNMKLN